MFSNKITTINNDYNENYSVLTVNVSSVLLVSARCVSDKSGSRGGHWGQVPPPLKKNNVKNFSIEISPYRRKRIDVKYL